MARFLAHILPLLVLNSAYAADIQDAPIPVTTNWIGITIFLVIFLGGCIGFIWMVFRNDKKSKNLEKNVKG